MRLWIKRWASLILVPVTQWYLRTEHTYRYHGISVKVKPGVFHPGLFSSTRFLLTYLEQQDLKDKTLLELGCGTALISIFAAHRNARVTATDINPLALENARSNASANAASINFIESDLFEKIRPQAFDWIIVNPPYYARAIRKPDELAWHCGENFEYFHKFFEGLSRYTHSDTQVIMVLTAGCNLKTIFDIASTYHVSVEQIATKKVLFDGEDYLYRLKPGSQAQV